MFQSTQQQIFSICLDIETCNSEQAFQLESKFVKANSNIKDEEKKAGNIAEKLATMKEKSALLDTAPIGVIGLQIGEGMPIVLHTDVRLPSGVMGDQNGGGAVQCTTFNCSKDMFIGLRNMLDTLFNTALQAGQVLTIVGFNSIKFDIPKLRLAYIRHGLKLPIALRPNIEGVINYDVMLKFTKYYTKNESPYIGLDHVCALLGVGEVDKPLDSSKVPGMLEAGETATVALHCGLDVAKTALCWRLMESLTGE